MASSEQDLQTLHKSKIALLGFGAQAEASWTNLKRSGVNPPIIGVREDGKSAEKLRALGLSFKSIPKALEGADTVLMNLGDQSQREIYEKFIRERKSIRRLVFAHGFNSHFGLIPLEKEGPLHILVAPKGAASGLKEFFGTDSALPAILSVLPKSAEADERNWVESFARALGCNPKGLIWASFKDETECDLFSEQALLCGGVSSLLRAAFEVMTEDGYSPETAYFESLFELKLIVDLIWREGITGMRGRISTAARYGDITRGDRIIDPAVKTRMREILKEIQSGKFAKEFLAGVDSKEFKAREAEQAAHPIELIGKRIRKKLGSE